MNKYFFIISIFLISISTIFAQKNTIITGEVANIKDSSSIYLQNMLTKKIIAEDEIDRNGKYELKFKISEFDFYRIIFKNNRKYILYMPIPGEKANINIDFADIENPKVAGSEHTELYYTTKNQLDKLNTQEQIGYVKNLINKNPKSPVSMIYVEKLDIATNFDYFKKVSDGLKKYKSNSYIKSFQAKVKNEGNLKIGKVAPEIALKSPEGKVIKLSSLRGKYVLIDFWASWCRPCRAESPNMVKVYNKYHSKGFDIYSVSLDQKKESWEKAIIDDNLGNWAHVSDLKSWKSEGGKAYNVKSIPYTVLLDKDGKIIAKGLRGYELDKKIEEIFR